jgi:hypothetical protein
MAGGAHFLFPTRQFPVQIIHFEWFNTGNGQTPGAYPQNRQTDFHLRRDLGRITPLRLLFPTPESPPPSRPPGAHPNPHTPPPHAKLAREAADASARKRKAADGGEAAAAAPVPGEEVAMGDVPQSGGDGTADPDPIASLGADTGGGGGCSDPVSVELSMGGDYYHACCGDANLDIPEGPKLPFVGDKVSAPLVRRSPSVAPRSGIIDYCPCGEMGLRHPYCGASVVLPF